MPTSTINDNDNIHMLASITTFHQPPWTSSLLGRPVKHVFSFS
jgi:hypothetical protein